MLILAIIKSSNFALGNVYEIIAKVNDDESLQCLTSVDFGKQMGKSRDKFSLPK